MGMRWLLSQRKRLLRKRGNHDSKGLMGLTITGGIAELWKYQRVI